jgi:DNA-directed RNA polymerase specialized sigma24 family protein
MFDHATDQAGITARRPAGMRASVVDRARAEQVSKAPELAPERVVEAFGRWQARELRLARSFRECQGLTRQALEDIYQDTVLDLLGRPYENEKHLRDALHAGLKMRALGSHSKASRREEIENHPQAYERSDAGDSPERAALLREDRLIVAEFLAGLSAIEQRVFWLLAEGRKYRGIATALGIDINVARNAARACERKREHFQLLYDAGRLCRFRESTITALQSEQATSRELACSALAHLERCATCRAQHRTNARRLRLRFQGQAAVLLPMPTILSRAGLLTRFVRTRGRALQHRLATDAPLLKSPDMRERTIALLAGGSATAKIAAGVASVALIAGTISATHALDPHSPRHPHQISHPVSSTQSKRLTLSPLARVHANAHRNGTHDHQPRVPGRIVPTRAPGHLVSDRAYNEFVNPAVASPPVKKAGSRSEEHAYREFSDPRHVVVPVRRQSPPPEQQKGGGPFSP